jgi:hypothetical protein
MMEEPLDEREMSAAGRACAGVSRQVEQEVCYDASLFKPSKSRSLNVEGS